AVGPEGVKIRLCINRLARIRMVIPFGESELLDLVPRVAAIVTEPEDDVAAGHIGLRSGRRGSDDAPSPIRFDVEAAVVVVVIGSGEVENFPRFSGPAR